MADYETPDPKPRAIPLKFKKLPTTSDQIKELLFNADVQRYLSSQDVETFEEANDFDIPDDPPDPQSRWEAEYEASQVYPVGWQPPKKEAPPEPLQVRIVPEPDPKPST